ncbi:MAG: hypothetical protein QOF72_1322 [Blastocatellia bacterium]|jgi:uncharacterized protein (DUF1697 family)|nr:hypothetical protein [Blastocatellia bacterium]
MPKYVALLRAINVGGHTVKMDYLRNLFVAMGFSNVESFIASGNVIFDSRSKDGAALERKIEKHLQTILGYEVKTFVRSISELAAVANYKPFSESELSTHSLYVGFAAETPSDHSRQKLLSFICEVDDLHVHGREVYWLCRAKMMTDSGFSGALAEKALGMGMTFRNSTTVKKLAAKYQ